MLNLIIKQTNWSIIGAIFGFLIGFLVKIYLIDIVGLVAWGKYVAAHAFASGFDTILSLGIPFVLLKFIPNYINNNMDLANKLISKSFLLLFKISLFFLLFIFLFSSYIDKYFYSHIDDFNFILVLVSIHAPISVFTGFITALYRSVFKIKDLIIIGTFIIVPIRALLTLIVFYFTDNIIYFIVIELFTTSFSLLLLYYFFNKNEFSLSLFSKTKYVFKPNQADYRKKMYFNSLISFCSSKSLSIILSLSLPPKQIAIFGILMTITGITMFLVKSLNKVFAPAISKLFHEGKILELNTLYKQTSFILNFLALPFCIIIIFFAEDILFLYDKTGELSLYKVYLYVLMFSRIISLSIGSSGMFMIMAGLEKKELKIQTINTIIIITFATLFIQKYELLAVVSLFIGSSLFINFSQLYYIIKNIKISPFSKDLFWLYLLSIFLIYYAINYAIVLSIYHYFIIPIVIYILYSVIFLKQILHIFKKIKESD
tara:strand:+ start:169837 stop:171294 length:1458 start_codon:yes stop_codon:yes gene_type:complete